MFAYGDTSRNPIPETVDVLEALTVLFVRKTVTRALDHVRRRLARARLLAAFNLSLLS